MNGWLNKIRNWMYRFMYGRYGGDDYGRFIFTIAIIFDIVALISGWNILLWIAEGLLIYGIFRTFSKNITKRYQENQMYLRLTATIRRRFKTITKNCSDHDHRYYLCPKCKQIVRVPKGHGKVEIHCPKCGEYFTRKSQRINLFGYIITNHEKLTEDQQETYHSFYCGLCFGLSKKYGKTFSMLLNNDMTFLTVVLTGLEEPESTLTIRKCPIHLRRKQNVSQNMYTDYAVDMTVLLSYYKALDDEQDEHSHSRFRKKLETPMESIRKTYPSQSKGVEEALKKIAQYEKENSTDLDALCNASGDMVQAIFSCPNISFRKEMEGLGHALGKFIYLMDAYDDLDEDIKKDRFNPLKQRAQEEDFDAKIESYLELFLSEAADCFERMPILEYSDIIRNILYSGVWTRFEQIKAKKEGKK